MTRALRQRHRRTLLFLAVMLPVAFIAALVARRPVPVNGALVSDSARGALPIQQAGVETGAPSAKP